MRLPAIIGDAAVSLFVSRFCALALAMVASVLSRSAVVSLMSFTFRPSPLYDPKADPWPIQGRPALPVQGGHLAPQLAVEQGAAVAVGIERDEVAHQDLAPVAVVREGVV